MRPNGSKPGNININDKRVEIIAYCIMPTHLHLILKQLKNNGISVFMGNILNSYSRYFNLKHKRKGPLWEGRFKNILVKNDEQLLHLTRYIHLNPVTASLVSNPEDWNASSYREYLQQVQAVEKICKYDDILEIDPVSYKKFVEDRISYQRDLAKIKNLIFE
ncbi:MAG: transposase [Candidatus Omnitrophica bacterium]|nr:transposase [Candidatus Omnitrophota bacterium]